METNFSNFSIYGQFLYANTEQKDMRPSNNYFWTFFKRFI